MTANHTKKQGLERQLGRLVAIVAKLHALEMRPCLHDKAQLGMELIRLADELGAPMSDKTRMTLKCYAESV